MERVHSKALRFDKDEEEENRFWWRWKWAARLQGMKRNVEEGFKLKMLFCIVKLFHLRTAAIILSAGMLFLGLSSFVMFEAIEQKKLLFIDGFFYEKKHP